MAQDEGRQEEKFDFTQEGEALGYISLDQARVLAMQTARQNPGAYGRRFADIPMAFDVAEAEETEDYYEVTLSYRPQGQFSGTPGQEQFFIEKAGTVAHRQVRSLPGPERGRRFPVVPVAIGLVVVVIAAVAFVVFVGDRSGSGSGEDNPVTGSISTNTPGPTPTLLPTESVDSPSTSTARPTFVPSGGMRRGASISGRVTDAETGLPIANMDFGAEFGNVDSEDISEARTDDSGNFVFQGLPAGIIRVHVHDKQGYVVQGGVIWAETLGPGEAVEGVNFSFKRGATISGKVTDVDTGLPILGLSIRTEDDRGGTGDSFDSGRDGRYTIVGLAPGVYVVTAEGGTKGYIREFYDDKYAWEDAARVAVIGTEAVEGIDFGLKRGANISGTVIDAETGLPIANMDVKASVADGDDISWDETDINGRYTLKGIPDGVVEVVVGGQGYVQMSKTVTVRDGQDVTDFDF